MGGQEIDLQLRPERGECAALEIGCVSCPARVRGQDRINEDYVGVMLGDLAERAARGSVIALADGVSGSKGGRVAAELAVRTFIDAYYGLPDTLQPGVAAARALEAIHGWLHQIGRVDPAKGNLPSTSLQVVPAGQVEVIAFGSHGCAQMPPKEMGSTWAMGVFRSR